MSASSLPKEYGMSVGGEGRSELPYTHSPPGSPLPITSTHGGAQTGGGAYTVKGEFMAGLRRTMDAGPIGPRFDSQEGYICFKILVAIKRYVFTLPALSTPSCLLIPLSSSLSPPPSSPAAPSTAAWRHHSSTYQENRKCYTTRNLSHP